MGLNVNELLNIDVYRLRLEKRDCFPVNLWPMILTNVSHLCLTANSSLNFAIYCVVSREFRYCRATNELSREIVGASKKHVRVTQASVLLDDLMEEEIYI